MRIRITYYRFLDGTGDNRIVGGVETYLLNLSGLFARNGWDAVLYQCAETAFSKDVSTLKVVGVPVVGLDLKKQRQVLYARALEEMDSTRDILLFGADHCSVPDCIKRSISIQHGIGWDVPPVRRPRGVGRVVSLLRLLRSIRSAVILFNQVPNTVCVDYNFPNWYRATLGCEPPGRYWVIPNSPKGPIADQPLADKHQRGKIKVMYSRRFERERGSRLFMGAAVRLLEKHQDVEVTFAGDGADAGYLRENLGRHPRVRFTRYLQEDAVGILADFHIAVVPSIGSEGTSYSVSEAMAAGCAVVATPIGGVANMILDGYNGLLVLPNEQSLFSACSDLVVDKALRIRLAEGARMTVRTALSFCNWESKWTQVIREVDAEPVVGVGNARNRH